MFDPYHYKHDQLPGLLVRSRITSSTSWWGISGGFYILYFFMFVKISICLPCRIFLCRIVRNLDGVECRLMSNSPFFGFEQSEKSWYLPTKRHNIPIRIVTVFYQGHDELVLLTFVVCHSLRAHLSRHQKWVFD